MHSHDTQKLHITMIGLLTLVSLLIVHDVEAGTLDDTTIGSTTPAAATLTNANVNSGLNVGSDLGGRVNVDGSSDEIQLWVQGNGTQTNPLALFEDSSGLDLLRIYNNGEMRWVDPGNPTVNYGYVKYGSSSLEIGGTTSYINFNTKVATTGLLCRYLYGTGTFYITNSDQWTFDTGSGANALLVPFKTTISSGEFNVGTDLGGKVNIDGSGDEVQLWVQGNSTQTNSLALFEQSDGTDRFLFSNTGTMSIASVTTSIAATGSIVMTTAGAGLSIKEGTDATMGVTTLTSGTATVTTNKVTNNSRIFLTTQALGTVGSPQAIAVTARTSGTSFTITSESATDTSSVAWLLVEPS